MTRITRRGLLGAAAAGTAATVLPAALLADSATAATHSANATGTIADVAHVIILMQENRSFDHYFGSLKGVRGFSDRATLTIAGTNPVFNQANGSKRQYPWELSANAGSVFYSKQKIAQCDGSLDHGWATQHAAWDLGRMDNWVSAKGSVRTLGYLNRSDIPFHYALADAYTVCDAYHCSILSATGPNRTYLWSGSIDPAGTHGGPAYDGGDESGLTYLTFAETLQNAGITWKVYQNASDNYGDNGLAYFTQFAGAAPGTPLHDRGMASVPATTGSTPDDIAAAIAADAAAGTLPQVSWVVANEAFSEHPDAPPSDGAHFINLILGALAGTPAVFNSTVLFLNYDENDGFFDHVQPPSPPSGTADEFVMGTAIGLGFRVPMVVISPWSRGGWVSSEVFDHTSVIRFVETWSHAIGKPVTCPNISAWRRAIVGDLTSVFDFTAPAYGLPALPATTSIIGQNSCTLVLNPSPTTNAMPAQEAGTKSARPVPYQPNGFVDHLEFDANGQILLWIAMANQGAAASRSAAFSIYANQYRTGGPWQYTVAAGGTAIDYFNVGSGYGNGLYDLTLLGPNRFLRHFAGNATTAGKAMEVGCHYAIEPGTGKLAIYFTMTNTSTASATFTITSNHYRTDGPWHYTVPAGGSVSDYFNAVAYANGWYDFSITTGADTAWSRRFTGHLETATNSISG